MKKKILVLVSVSVITVVVPCVIAFTHILNLEERRDRLHKDMLEYEQRCRIEMTSAALALSLPWLTEKEHAEFSAKLKKDNLPKTFAKTFSELRRKTQARGAPITEQTKGLDELTSTWSYLLFLTNRCINEECTWPHVEEMSLRFQKTQWIMEQLIKKCSTSP